jgi:hypothetical protein
MMSSSQRREVGWTTTSTDNRLNFLHLKYSHGRKVFIVDFSTRSFMTTSVKMSEEGKNVLDTLQAKLLLATGKKLSQQELLDLLVKLSAQQEDELVKLIAGVKLPLHTEELEKLMKLPTDWGIKTEEKEIDEILYSQKGDKQT